MIEVEHSTVFSRTARASLCVAGAAIVVLLTACAPGPTHPRLRDAELPELIPLRAFFTNVETNRDDQILPDGRKLAVADRRLTVHFRTMGEAPLGAIAAHSSRSVPSFLWARDSRHILDLQDRLGDENDHIALWTPPTREPGRAASPGSRTTVRSRPLNDLSHAPRSRESRWWAIAVASSVFVPHRSSTERSR